MHNALLFHTLKYLITMKLMLSLAAAGAALFLASCEADVHTPAGESSTTVVAPGADEKTETNTTVTPSGSTSSTTTTQQ